MLQCVAVYCSVLQCVAVCCSLLRSLFNAACRVLCAHESCVAVCVAMCVALNRLLQLEYPALMIQVCVAVCRNVLQCVAKC